MSGIFVVKIILRKMKILLPILILLSLLSCKGQSINEKNTVSDDFNRSPPVYYGMPDFVGSSDTSAAWNQGGQKLLLTGKVLHHDGKTPAPNVLIYYYQTNQEGKYIHKESEERSVPPNNLGQTHGYIRGWVKSDKDGQYSIYTARPGSYPSRTEPAHIHVNIKEPDMETHYYIDNFVFDDDKLLNKEARRKMEYRGGSGVLRLVHKDGLSIAERNIILGLNIPNHPKFNKSDLSPGIQIGEDVMSFTPQHAWGPDKGSKTCPVCKYGWYHGILYFVGNDPNWEEIESWLRFLENESTIRNEYLKVYFVYANEQNFNASNRIIELEKLGKKLNLEKVAITFVPSFSDKASEIYLNNIDQNVENTFIIYKRSKVIDRFINLRPNQKNFDMISHSLDQSINDYFTFPKSKQ